MIVGACLALIAESAPSFASVSNPAPPASRPRSAPPGDTSPIWRMPLKTWSCKYRPRPQRELWCVLSRAFYRVIPSPFQLHSEAGRPSPAASQGKARRLWPLCPTGWFWLSLSLCPSDEMNFVMYWFRFFICQFLLNFDFSFYFAFTYFLSFFSWCSLWGLLGSCCFCSY